MTGRKVLLASGKAARAQAGAPFLVDPDVTIWHGGALDVLSALGDGSADACVTSPPYLDARAEYDSPTRAQFDDIFADLARVVSGPMLWNVGRLWRDGVEQLWWLELIAAARLAGWEHWDTRLWLKPNANPIQGRVFTNSHEYVLVFGRDGAEVNVDSARTPYPPATLARYERGFAANSGVKGHDRPVHRRHRSVEADAAGARPRSYTMAHTGGEKGNPHPAPMAEAFALELVALATWPGQTVLDPFGGSGTTARAARTLGRKAILIERDEAYCILAARRLSQLSLLAEGAA